MDAINRKMQWITVKHKRIACSLARVGEQVKNKMTAPKVVLLILLCWYRMSEAIVGSMAADVEPSHQYSIIFCCSVTRWQQRGSLIKWHLTRKYMWNKGVSCSIWKKWHSRTSINTSWTFLETKQCMWEQRVIDFY